MKIIFKQSPSSSQSLPVSPLESLGVERCYLKYLSSRQDHTSVTRKRHHHTNFEIHIIETGYQIYETDAGIFTVNEGELLLFPPLFKHRIIEESPATTKYSITFALKSDSSLSVTLPENLTCHIATIPSELSNSCRLISAETGSSALYSSLLISGRMTECILLLLRLVNPLASSKTSTTSEPDEDVRLILAKQYIHDNIRQDISLSELAAYCRISTKQLTRIFRKEEGFSATEYIRRERCLHIEQLLANSSLTLREISDEMNFNNEYYFNTFFKKYAGITPGAYRQSFLCSR